MKARKEKSKPARKRPSPKARSFFVYLLRTCDDGRAMTYVGWTTDIDARLAKHNAGTGARTTRGRVWLLAHSEKLKTREAAMSREWHLKRDRKFRKGMLDGTPRMTREIPGSRTNMRAPE